MIGSATVKRFCKLLCRKNHKAGISTWHKLAAT